MNTSPLLLRRAGKAVKRSSSPEHPKACLSWPPAPDLQDPETATVQLRGAGCTGEGLGVQQTGDTGTKLPQCPVFLHSVLTQRCAGMLDLTLPAKSMRACCRAGVPVRLLPRRHLPSPNEGFLSLLPGCLGAGVAGFDKWKWKSPSWGPALCGGVCTQLAAWERPSGGCRSHLVPPASMEAALAKRGVGLGALRAMQRSR